MQAVGRAGTLGSISAAGEEGVERSAGPECGGLERQAQDSGFSVQVGERWGPWKVPVCARLEQGRQTLGSEAGRRGVLRVRGTRRPGGVALGRACELAGQAVTCWARWRVMGKTEAGSSGEAPRKAPWGGAQEWLQPAAR